MSTLIYILHEEPVALVLKIQWRMNKNNLLHKHCYCYPKKTLKREEDKKEVYHTEEACLKDDGILKAPQEFITINL